MHSLIDHMIDPVILRRLPFLFIKKSTSEAPKMKIFLLKLILIWEKLISIPQ